MVGDSMGGLRRLRLRALVCVGVVSVSTGCDVATGTIEGVGPPFRRDWELKARMLEGGSVYDENSLEELAETHVPEVRLQDGRIYVTVPLVMANDHWVSTIYLRDTRDVIVSYVELTRPFPNEAFGDVTLSFDVPARVSAVVAYAHCTEHGVWKSAPLALPSP